MQGKLHHDAKPAEAEASAGTDFKRNASQSLLPQEQIGFYPFSPATCASEKIPLGSQTCERSECAAASRHPLKREPSVAGLV